ncbi:glutamate mutase [Nocardioides anomalus]|uniref:Glutamate mutase n=1 Tax=Nocardioides anomalus TaxID=2712223 RepID=A0A6G6WGI3_9ACTN|nr:glutamate mutase L [Nocardioides anomalus]QIG44342.1 glutamate mutase [Nocardioides anomalus]
MTQPGEGRAVCVDFGSTFTKALLVDLAEGRVLAGAEHRTTIDTDVLDGYDACLAALGPGAQGAEVLACSSAGGGLRIAVVGNEELVTAEAGRRVALSSGGKVVTVRAVAQGHDLDLTADAPDVVLLVGGTDGGNAEPLREAARGLRASGWRGPTVVAGNADAADEVSALLGEVPHVVAPNVVPRIGVLAPDGARRAIREVFLSHVIGGKHLSARADFTAMVRGATPDVVLTGVELLAEVAGEVVVVDVGGATTDVHSVVELDPEQAELARDVVAPTPVTRTVEGDLGMRWSAASTVEEAGLDELTHAAAVRRTDPGFLPTTEQEQDEDEAIARAAVGLALRRHAGRSRVVVSPEGRVVERSGVDLREVRLLVGSGGVLRHGRAGAAERVLRIERDGDWQLPDRAQVGVDTDYVLAAAGLLAADHPDAARRLVARLGDRLTP